MWVKYRPIKSPSNKNKKVKETYGIQFYESNACINLKAQLKTVHLPSKSFNNDNLFLKKKCKSFGFETKFVAKIFSSKN